MKKMIIVVLLFCVANISAASSFSCLPHDLTARVWRDGAWYDNVGRKACADRKQCIHCCDKFPLSPLRFPTIGCRGMLQSHPKPQSEGPEFCIINKTGMVGSLKTPWGRYYLTAKKIQGRHKRSTSIDGSDDCIIYFPPHHLYCVPKSFFRNTLTLERINSDHSLVVCADEHDPALARSFSIPSIQAVTSTLVVFNCTGQDLELNQTELGDYRKIQACSFCIISPTDLDNYRRVGMRLFFPSYGTNGVFVDVPTDWLRNDAVQVITISRLNVLSMQLSAHTLRACDNSLKLMDIYSLQDRGKLLAVAHGPPVSFDPYEGIPLVVEVFD
jgi:hypothetical protein